MSDGIDRLRRALDAANRSAWTNLQSVFIGGVRGLDLGEALATIDRLQGENLALEARVKALEEALRPFALLHEGLIGTLLPVHDRRALVLSPHHADEGDTCMGDLRHAAKVMEGRD